MSCHNNCNWMVYFQYELFCVRKVLWLENFLSHSWQSNCRCLLWVNSWVFKWLAWENFMSHWVQENGFCLCEFFHVLSNELMYCTCSHNSCNCTVLNLSDVVHDTSNLTCGWRLCHTENSWKTLLIFLLSLPWLATLITWTWLIRNTELVRS